MKKFFKRIVSGALACAMVGAVTIPTFAAAYQEPNPASISLYYNLGGGPQRTYDTCRVDTNVDNAYYVECTALINGDLTVTGVTCRIANDEHAINFTSTRTRAIRVFYGDFNDYTIFAGKLNVATTSKFAQANVDIGYSR